MIHHRSSRLMSLVQMFNQLTIFFLSFFLGKKKSKFQTFKKLFARKKRKEAAGAEAGMKSSQSSDNVSKTSEENTLTRSEKETGSGWVLSHTHLFAQKGGETTVVPHGIFNDYMNCTTFTPKEPQSGPSRFIHHWKSGRRHSSAAKEPMSEVKIYIYIYENWNVLPPKV